MKYCNYYGQFWEYLLLITPPEDAIRHIYKIKKEVGLRYGSRHALNSDARISLLKFLLVKGYEKQLLEELFCFCLNRMPFEIELNNFGVFPRHTLYVNVQENEGLKKLQNGLIMLLTASVPVRNEHLQAIRKHFMTIAGKLNPLQFESVSNEYRKKKISSSFNVRNIVLLKRPCDGNNSVNYRWTGSHSFVMGC
jgi:2'-5' RNA ligase